VTAPFAPGGTGFVGSPDPLAAAVPAGRRQPDLPDSPGSPWWPFDDAPFDDAPFDNAPFDVHDDVPSTLPYGPLDPLGPTVTDPPDILPAEPVNPVPVPEPGTFLLVGGGVAALVRTFRTRRQ
jgi:hypothetical protein